VCGLSRLSRTRVSYLVRHRRRRPRWPSVRRHTEWGAPLSGRSLQVADMPEEERSAGLARFGQEADHREPAARAQAGEGPDARGAWEQAGAHGAHAEHEEQAPRALFPVRVLLEWSCGRADGTGGLLAAFP